jgi:hypothetical protein
MEFTIFLVSIQKHHKMFHRPLSHSHHCEDWIYFMAVEDKIELREVVKAFIRGLKFTISLLEKVLNHEPI